MFFIMICYFLVNCMSFIRIICYIKFILNVMFIFMYDCVLWCIWMWNWRIIFICINNVYCFCIFFIKIFCVVFGVRIFNIYRCNIWFMYVLCIFSSKNCCLSNLYGFIKCVRIIIWIIYCKIKWEVFSMVSRNVLIYSWINLIRWIIVFINLSVSFSRKNFNKYIVIIIFKFILLICIFKSKVIVF